MAILLNTFYIMLKFINIVFPKKSRILLSDLEQNLFLKWIASESHLHGCHTFWSDRHVPNLVRRAMHSVYKEHSLPISSTAELLYCKQVPKRNLDKLWLKIILGQSHSRRNVCQVEAEVNVYFLGNKLSGLQINAVSSFFIISIC